MLQSGAYMTLRNLMDVSSINGMATFLILLPLSTWPSVVVKSRDLGHNLVMNRSLLFMRCLEAHKSRY